MKTDPRVKLLVIVLLTTLAVLAKDVIYLAVVVLAALLINILLKTDLASAFKRLRHFLWLLLFIALVQSLTIKGGTVLLHIGGANLLTTRGIQFAVEFILRMGVIVFAGLIATTTDGREMTDGLLKMHMPYELAFMSGIALRFLPVFREEFSARLNAISMRGIDLKKIGLFKKLKLYAYLISPTVSGCIIRSGELAKSMQSRGFRANKKRTMLRELKMTAKDWTIIAVSLILTACYLCAMYIHGTLVRF
jgi:energy-coupling factor transport system permease protein